MNFPVDAGLCRHTACVPARHATLRPGSPKSCRFLQACLPLFLLALPACQGRDQRADELAQQAQGLAAAGDRMGALRAINDAIRLRDDRADYFLLLSSIQLRGGSPIDAFLAARRALELDAANMNALTVLANVGMQIGQIDDAAAAADRMLVLEPTSLIALQVKGLVELYRNHDDQAEAIAERLQTIDPTNEAALIIRTRVLGKAGKYAEALDLLDQGMAQNAVTAPLLITKINLARAMNDPETMAQAYARLDESTPNLAANLRLEEINLLYAMGRQADARRKTADYLANGATNRDDLDALRRLWWQYDRVPFTRETIKGASDWSDPIALLMIGRYLLWQGEPQLADDLYFSFPEGPRPIGIAIHLRAAFALGREAMVEQDLKGVLEADTGNVDALLLQSELQERAGQIDRAIETVQRALNSDRSDPEIYVYLARLHAKAGSTFQAQQAFESGLEEMPQNFLLIERYTQFLHDSGNKRRAVSVSRAFARALPSSVAAWSLMARQCAWSGDAACAAEAAAGKEMAATRYRIDEPPGSPPDRGLLGKF